MKRGLMIGGGVLGAVVVVVIGVSVFLLSNLDSLVKEAVEKVGTDATQAKVTLSDVNISLKSGSGALRGLTVGNPKGFKTPSAFELGSISVTIDIGSVGSDPVIIKEIVITNPKVTYELGSGGSNVDAIQKNVEAYSKQFQSGGGEKKSGDGPKLIIENLYIRGGKISVSAAFLQGKALTTPLPDIHLKDIGKEEKGADPGQVVKEVIDSMTKGIGSAVGSLGLEDLAKGVTEGVSGAMKAVTEGASGATKQLKEGTGSVGGAVQEGVSEAGKSLKKLFGN